MKAALQHIHLIAPDKFELAKWYQDYLGFEVLGDIEEMGEKGGPIFISSDGGKTALSIFNDPGTIDNIKTICIPAFGLDPNDFIELFHRVSKEEESEVKIFDHYLFISFYFSDPCGTRIEINCMDVEALKKQLGSLNLKFEKFEPHY